MSKFGLLLKKDFLEIKRRKTWLIYLIVFSAISILSAVTAIILPMLLNSMLDGEQINGFQYSYSVATSYEQYISNMGEIGVLLIMIMFSGVLLKEKTSGTYYMLKSNGVKDYQIVLSHFITRLVLITVCYLASLVVFIPLNLVLFKEYTGVRGLVALLYLYLILVFSLALTIFVSSMIKRKSQGIFILIGVYFVFTILMILPYIGKYTPFYSLSLADNYISRLSEIKLSEYLINLGINLTLIVAMIVSSCYLYINRIDNRKEVK